MGLNNVTLVVEDRLSDAVATKILQHFDIEIVRGSYMKEILTFNERHRVTTTRHITSVVFYVDRLGFS